MSFGKSDSAPISDTTSASRPTNPTELSEQQFLEQQQDLARHAISHTWKQITAGIGHAANPVEWTRQYPWPALGAAVVTGFVAATSLVPTRREQALKRLAELEEVLRPSAPSAPAQAAVPAQSDKRGSRRGVMSSFILEALKTLQPVLISAISAKIGAGSSKNGHDSVAAGDSAVGSDGIGGSDSPA